MIKIEVFPLLEIFPSSLLLTPNMRYTLQIVGGPLNSAQPFTDGSSIDIKFDIDQKHIATVDQQNREVTGRAEGDATLRYWIIQQRSQNVYTPRGVTIDADEVSSRVVSKKQVPIRVRLATSVEIPYSSRQIYTQSLIKLNAMLKYNNEYFDNGIAPISYSWSTDQARVVSLEIPKESGSGASSLLQRSLKVRNNEKGDDHAVFTTPFNCSSVYVMAAKEGDAEISVQVAIEYPAQYLTQANWLESHAHVKVTPQLKIAVNDFSTASRQDTHMFLLPPNSIGYIKANIDTKLKLGYSIVSVYDSTTKTTK